MKVLHILKSEPDETITTMMEAHASDDVTTIAVYDEDVDWAALVDELYTHDKVICWW